MRVRSSLKIIRPLTTGAFRVVLLPSPFLLALLIFQCGCFDRPEERWDGSLNPMPRCDQIDVPWMFRWETPAIPIKPGLKPLTRAEQYYLQTTTLSHLPTNTRPWFVLYLSRARAPMCTSPPSRRSAHN